MNLNKFAVVLFIILLYFFVNTDGKRLGLRLKHRNHHQRLLNFAKEFTKALPGTWLDGYNYDIDGFESSAEYNCKNVYDLAELYKNFLNEFTSISKSDVQETSSNLENVLNLITSVREKLESQIEIPSLVEVNTKSYKNKAKALNNNPCLKKLIFTYKKQQAYEVLAIIQKQDLSPLTISNEIESSLKELINLCQDFLNNYDNYSTKLNSKKVELDQKLQNAVPNTNSTSLCPSNQTCSNGVCDYVGTYFIKTYLGQYVCAESDLFGSYSIEKYACAQFQISLSRKISSRSVYCLKNIQLGTFISISSDSDPTLKCEENTCSSLGEFYIDIDNVSGQSSFYFTSVRSGGIVSTSLDKLMTANKSVREESENLFLVFGGADLQLNYEGKYQLSSRLNSYVCPSDGTLSSSSSKKASCSAYEVTLKGVKYGQNTYCIKNILSGEYFYAENYNSPEESLKCQFTECTQWGEFFISEKEITSKKYVSFTSAATGRVITTEDSLLLSAYRESDDNNFGIFTLARFVIPVPGQYYFLKSMFGRYLDMNFDSEGYNYTVVTINTFILNRFMDFAKDGFTATLVPYDNEYYYLKSKSGRYIDLRQTTDLTLKQVDSISEKCFNNNLQNIDSFVVKLIDQNDGFYKIQSKYGRFLHMRHEKLSVAYMDAGSVPESYLSENPGAEDSYRVEFISA